MSPAGAMAAAGRDRGEPRHPRERSLSLALVSHTNAGKTTLARTLLGRDIGEVRDAPHVTDFSDAHVLVETAQGDRLTLWDTPGFGDSPRLAARLSKQSNPIGRFLAETWDRWRNRPLWASQQALRTMRDEADVLLYLVNASETIGAAGYIEPEMRILRWVGKPVIVLLNQLGAPREPAQEAEEASRWRRDLASLGANGGSAARETASDPVRAVLPLDAFARCWVQELALLDAIEAVLPAERRPLLGRLRSAWRQRRLATFDASMASLAASLARSAVDAEALPESGGIGSRLKLAGAALANRAGIGRGADGSPAGPNAAGQEALARRLDAEVRTSTQALLSLHGIGGDAGDEILGRLAGSVDVRLRLDEKRAAAWGGAVTGAIAGLKADVLSGGLTLGGGMLAGGLIGALGGAGLARGVNLVRGTGRSLASWKPEALDAMAEAALLRYLAVAHFGRGRGDWRQGELAPHWKGVVATALAAEHETLAAVWAERELPETPEASAASAEAIAIALEPTLRDAAAAALTELYPDAAPLFDGAAPRRAVPDAAAAGLQ